MSVNESTDTAPGWESAAPECRGCHRGFTMTRRRHHCRACGRTFCGTCSKHKDELPAQYNMEGPQRTCDPCHRNIKRLQIMENPDDHPPPPDPVAVKMELIQKLQAMVTTPEDSWIPKKSKKGVTIDALRIEDSSLFCVRARFSVKAPLAKVVSIYSDTDLWKKWQPEMLKCNVFEQINEQEEYMYILYKLPVLDKREVVLYSTMCEGSIENPKSKEERSLLSASVAHPLIGNTKGVVRALLTFGYTRFYPSEDGEHTHILSAYHTDPRGMIPPALVNSTISRATDQLQQMRSFIEKHEYEVPEVINGTGNPIMGHDVDLAEGVEELIVI